MTVLEERSQMIDALTTYEARCKQACSWGSGQRSKLALDYTWRMIEALNTDDQTRYEEVAREYTEAMAQACKDRAEAEVSRPGQSVGLAAELLRDLDTWTDLVELEGWTAEVPDGFAITKFDGLVVHVEAWYSHHLVATKFGPFLGDAVETATAMWTLHDLVAMTSIEPAEAKAS